MVFYMGADFVEIDFPSSTLETPHPHMRWGARMLRLPLLEEYSSLGTNHLVGMPCYGKSFALIHQARILKASIRFNSFVKIS